MLGLVGALVVHACLPPGAAHAFGKQSTADLQDQAIVVEAATIVSFEKGAPEKTQFGRLQWRGGLILSASSPFFGGWSGLAIDRDGARILSVSDSGVWLTARLNYDGTRPVALRDARIGAFRGADGLAHRRRRDIDAESIALLWGNLTKGEILVSFEQNHRVMRYPVTDEGIGMPVSAVPLPPDASQLVPNKSLEALCVLQAGTAKGTVLTFAERFPTADGSHLGWMRAPLVGRAAIALGKREATWAPVSIRAIDGFDLTDCAGLPDGDLLLLERRFRVSYGDPLRGPRMRIRRFKQQELLGTQAIAATPLVGETLLDVGTTHEIDNMEGLAVHIDPKGTTILTLISDDNFNSYLQRTVLLQFSIDAAPSKPVAKGEK